MGVPIDILQRTTSGAVLAKPGRWHGSDLYSTGATDTADAIVYDSLSASGTKIGGGHALSGASVRIGPLDGNFYQCRIGLYISVSGASPVVDTHYTESQ